MFSGFWLTRGSMTQTLIIFTIVAASIVVVSSVVVQEDSLLRDNDSLQYRDRLKRAISANQEEHSIIVDEDAIEERDKKIPRGFLGLRGKKAPSSFLGLRGRRSDSEEYFEEDLLPYKSYEDVPNTLDDMYPKLGEPLIGPQQVVHPLELIKRTPSGFFGMRGKKAPSGFLGMRGKKIPSSFLGLRGKRPSGFLGMRGKKDNIDYEDLESILQTLRNRYINDQEYYTEDKRIPRGFLGLRGKKNYLTMHDGPSDTYYDQLDKRAPSSFLGLRG